MRWLVTVGTWRFWGQPRGGVSRGGQPPPCSPAGSNYYVRILSTIDRELLKPNASVALHKHSNALVDVLPPEADSSIMMLTSGGPQGLLSGFMGATRLGRWVLPGWGDGGR